MACILNDGTLTLSGDVGGDYFGGEGFTYSDVVMALAQVEDQSDLVVRLNSAGGIATEGAAIHALLARRPGKTDIIVDGMAVSAASLIAMAGDTVTMTMGAYLMIHDPSGFTVGTSADHAKSIEGLEVLATSYARVYAAKSGKPVPECREIMKAETWYTAEEAVDAGFADASDESKASPATAFDYRVYAHAPKRLKALAAKKNWRLPGADDGGPSAAANRQNKETSMSDDKKGGDTTAELDRLRAENATLKASQGADEQKARDDELATLRAEKEARENADAVMALEEAKGREPQAKALAAAGVKADAAKAILAAAPKADTQEEPRRLNGEGLSGKPTTTTAQAPSMVANMRKLLGKEAA